jgi:ATP-binding protein involved in chromosome partitioning
MDALVVGHIPPGDLFSSGEALDLSEADIRLSIGAVQEPDLRRGLDELGMVGPVRARRRGVEIELIIPSEHWPATDQLVERVRQAVVPADPRIEVRVMNPEERTALLQRLAAPPGGEPPNLARRGQPTSPAPQSHSHGGPTGGGAPKPLGHEEGRPNRFMIPTSRTRVIGISSGKGGVGKSSVAVNLAVALAQKGREVGLLDADVYGFSVPAMLGVDRDPASIGDLLVPPVVHGVRILSMGFFVPDDQPVIWRGPMLHKALEQFLVDAYWGEPDYLLIDMPPGTGDVALSLGQYLPRTEIVVVTTPQAAAQRVAQRSAIAAKTLKLPVRGVIENMSWFTGDEGTRYELFGSGGGDSLAEALGVPLLGKLPLVPKLRQAGDEGTPVAVVDPDGEAARAFAQLAEKIDSLGPARIYRTELAVR